MATSDERWESRPWRARLLRLIAAVGPFVFGLGVAILLSRVVPIPDSLPGVVLWWIGIVIASTIALRLADRQTKKLLPLAVLMKLSLVFPDKAPRRFSVALRTGGTRNLEQLIEESQRAGREDDLSRAAETILALGAKLNAHDPRTRGHAERVRAYADMIGEEMGYNEEQRNRLMWAAMLHDIGKLRVPSEIINKPGKLDDDEWAIMRRHPEWGMELAAPLVPWLGEFSAAIGQHHEKFDGSGYPNGMAGEDIGMAARITAVADAFDVMTSVRSYKDARPASEAREELARSAGSHFDPLVVRHFLNIALGRQRWVAGPISWLAQSIPAFQGMMQAFTTAATHAAAAVQTGAAAAAITTTAVVVPNLINTPQQAVAEEPAPLLVAVDDTLPVTEDDAGALDVLANDLGRLDPSTLRIVTPPAHGSLVFGEDGRLEYTPDPEFSGTDTIVYEVCDFAGECDQGSLSIVVAEVDDPPVITPSGIATDEATPVRLPVLERVRDPEGSLDPASLRITATPSNGVALVGDGGVIVYTPRADFNGTDRFTYTVCDTGGLCSSETVQVTVRPVNEPPTLRAIPVVGLEDEPTSIVLDAADPDGDPLTGRLVALPDHGNVTIEAPGLLTYLPEPDYNGPDQFRYQVCDPAGACVQVTVRVTVEAVNDPPEVPGPGPLTTAEDTPVSFEPLAGASDVDGDALTLVAFDATTVAGGTVASGSLIYTPPPDWSGVDTFTYQVGDGKGATVTVPVTVTVTPVNDAPAGVFPTPTATEDQALTFDVAGSFTDVDGDPLTVTVLSPATTGGGSAVANDDGTITYTPKADFNGADSFSVKVDDGNGGAFVGLLSLTVDPVNDVPVAVDDVATTPLDTPIAISVLDNDTDVDGDPLGSVTVVTPPSDGSYWISPSGVITYSPDTNFVGPETFTYTVSDGTATSAAATVTVHVKTVVGVADAYALDEDTLLAVPAEGVLANDVHPDFTTITATVDTPPLHGLLILDPDGSFSYKPEEHYSGTDEFVYFVSDGTRNDLGTVTLTINPIPDAPEAVADAYLTGRDTPLIVAAPGLLANDNDYDGDPLTATTTVLPANGTVVLNPGGSFTYTPDSGFVGNDTFTYRVDDGTGRSDTATVTVTVDSGVTPAGLFFGSSGPGPDEFSFTATPPGPATPVPDYDGDSNPGLTILASGGGLGESNPAKYQLWSLAPSAPLELNGPVTAALWSTVEFFSLDGGGDYKAAAVHPVIYVQDCAPDGSDCTLLLSTDVHVSDWNGGVADWVYREMPVGFLDHTVPVGRKLVMKVLFKHDDVWVAMTGAYPSRLLLTEANRAPEANDDILDDVDPLAIGPAADEDVTVNIDVLGNDVDVNLDPATLTITRLPAHGTAAVVAGTIDYTSGADTSTPVDFDYEICDTSGECSTATVYVSIHPVNDAPSFTKGGDQAVLEDAGAQTVLAWATGMSPGPVDEAGQSLAFALAPDLPGLFAAGPAVDEATGDLSYTPAPDAAGTATVTVTLSDDGGTAYGGVDTSPAQTFTITLDPVNDEPSFTSGGDVTVLEDAGAYSAPWASSISMGPSNESAQTGTFTITANSNPALFAAAPAVSPAGTLTFTPADDAFGSADLDIRLQDSGGTANGGDDTSPTVSFTVTVDPVNDAPGFTLGASPTVLEDAGPQVVAGFATAISPGAANESSQTLTFTVSAATPALFSDQPAIDEVTGDLEFTPAPDAVGTSLVAVELEDDGGTANGGSDSSGTQLFSITLDPVNDEPSFSGADVTVLEDSGAYSAAWASSISMGPPDESSQTATYTVTANSNPALFAVAPAVAGDGTLTFTPAADANGAANVDVEMQDSGGTANGGDDTSPTVSFVITVDPANDPPEILDQAFSVDENVADGTIVGTVVATDPDLEPLTYAITAGNGGGWFDIDPSTGELTVKVPPGVDHEAAGSHALTVEVTDSGPATDSATVTVTIDDVNDPPVLAPIGDENAMEGNPFSLTVSATDEDIPAQPLSLSQTGLPAWATFTDNGNGTATIAGTPGAADVGTTSVAVTVDDGLDTDAETFDLTVDPLPTGLVAINEILYEERLGEYEEFVELYNNSGASYDLTGWRLADGNLVAADVDAVNPLDYTIPALDESGRAATLDPGEYAVIWIQSQGGSANEAPEADLEFDAGLGLNLALNSLGDDVFLYDAGLNLIDYVTYGDPALPGNEINTPPAAPPWNSTYSPANAAAIPLLSGDTLALTPNGQDGDHSACWEPTGSGLASGRAACAGAPVTAAADPDKRNASPGLSNTDPYETSAWAGQVAINEVMYAESDAEFVEIYNSGAAAVDLSGWTLADGNLRIDDRDGGGSSMEFVLPGGSSLTPGGHAVIWLQDPGPGRQASPSVDLELWAGANNSTLSGGDDMWLYDASLGLVDYIAWGNGGAINEPPSPLSRYWDDTAQLGLGGAPSGGSISLTPDGVDGNDSACWEHTASGTSGCGAITVDNDDFPTRIASPGDDNNLATADLSVAKVVSDARPSAGAVVTYTVTVTNNSLSNAAAGVGVTDTLPAGVTWQSDDSAGAYNPGTGVWTVGAVPANSSRTLNIDVLVGAAPGATVTNSAAISAAGPPDPDAANNSASVDFTVNRPPDAADDSFTPYADVPLTLDVLGNDSDPEGDPITITAWDAISAQGGTVDCSSGSSCTYLGPLGFASPPDDSFTYTIEDDRGATDTATVTLTVTPLAGPPLWLKTDGSTLEDQLLTLAPPPYGPTAPGPGMPDWNDGADGKPGRTLRRSGLATPVDEIDDDKFQTWAYTVSDPGGLTISGPVRVSVYSAMKDFDTGKSGELHARLSRCPAAATRDSNSCATLGLVTLNSAPSPWASGGAFSLKTLNFGSVGPVTIPAGEQLRLKLVTGGGSQDDLYMAFDTNSHAALLLIP